MTEQKDANWSRVFRPFAPAAQEPGPKAKGLTQDWSHLLAQPLQAPDAESEAVAAQPAGPRHARKRAFLAVVARSVGTALIALGSLVVAAGTVVRGMASE